MVMGLGGETSMPFDGAVERWEAEPERQPWEPRRRPVSRIVAMLLILVYGVVVPMIAIFDLMALVVRAIGDFCYRMAVMFGLASAKPQPVPDQEFQPQDQSSTH